MKPSTPVSVSQASFDGADAVKPGETTRSGLRDETVERMNPMDGGGHRG
jgi:hypothetical protein